MFFYVLLSIEFCLFLTHAKSETQNHSLYFYAFFTQLFLYGFFYKAMRNLKIYIFCLAIGMLHFCLYYLLKENASLISFHNNTIITLRNTVILLIIFQLLRFISLQTQKQELACPSSKNKTVFHERYNTRIDTILLLIYLAATILLMFF